MRSAGASLKRENAMRQSLSAGAIALALLGSVSIAAAQSGMSGSSASGSGRVDLSPAQEQSVSKGLASQPTQNAPAGYNAQIGGQLPSSLKGQALPSSVQSEVPEAKALLFVKLPDRLLLIDPATQIVAEIITAGASTTGASDSTAPK
jgi:hypothetical protein